MKIFHVVDDEHGQRVADGIEFDDDTTVVHQFGDSPFTVIFPSADDAREFITDGPTSFVYLGYDGQPLVDSTEVPAGGAA